MYRIFAASAVALATVLAGSTMLAGPAQASPTRTAFTDDFSFTADGFCDFDVTLAVHDVGTGTVIAVGSGYREIDHVVETDTFTANGRTLVGVPYTYNVVRWQDAYHNDLSATGVGEMWFFRLPDGRIVHAAGWHLFNSGIYRGEAVDLAPVCAYLAG